MKTTCLSAATTAAIPSSATLPGWFRNTRTSLCAIATSLATFTQVFAQPVITMQPQSQTNVVGSVVMLSVTATGTPPLFYQWRRLSSNVAGETNDSLVIASLQNSNVGNYTVVITNTQGVVTSAIAFVRIGAPPAITVQPIDQIVDVGGTTTFTIAATGTAPLAYQWRFKDADIAGQTNFNLVLTNVQSGNAGNYAVVVANVVGSVTSRIALLTLNFPAVHRFGGITANPDHTISLNLAGVVPRLFAPYYDIYPLDASANLVNWLPLAMLQRTNASLDVLSFLDSEAASFDKRFYRTLTNFLVTPFPKPSGPYPVGTVSRLLTDPSRTNRYNIPTNSSFMVTFWYPAEATAGALPDAYLEMELTQLFPSIWISPSTVARFVSHALPGLALATNEASYPVLIYSHGAGAAFRRQNTDKALELASHGYVVAAMDHMDAVASVFPSGQVVFGAGSPDLNNRIKDILFVTDELSRLNSNDALFAGRLDLEQLGAFGFSWGGVPVAEFCRIDARCKAVALLDAGCALEWATNLVQLGLQKPFLSMNSTMLRPSCPNFPVEWLAPSTNLFAKATNHAFWCQIQDSPHIGFSDRGALIDDPLIGTGGPTPASRGQSLAIRACMLSFFDKYLKNQDDHLLDKPTAVYTNIINFQRK